VTTCSQDSLAAHEPLPGTAPYATAWIVIEQPGPWGREALVESHLDRDVARHLSQSAGTGVGVLLARHPDRPERSRIEGRNVWLARTYPGAAVLRHALLDRLDQICDWDLAAIGAGVLPPLGSVSRSPMLFICTHSGRDLCCATSGRALMSNLMERLPAESRNDVWECSHIGGHRFAPVSLSLPMGTVHGRLDLDSVLGIRLRARDGQVIVDRLRGRSSLLPPLQVAAIEVQRRHGVDSIDDLDVLLVRDGVVRAVQPAAAAPLAATRSIEAEVRHSDGRAWRATLIARTLERDRLESCGKDPVPGIAWSCVRLDDAPAWR
jgi:hypothetical protein